MLDMLLPGRKSSFRAESTLPLVKLPEIKLPGRKSSFRATWVKYPDPQAGRSRTMSGSSPASLMESLGNEAILYYVRAKLG